LLHFLRIHNRLINFIEMFIFNSKSLCCSGTFTNALLTLLLTKNI